MCFGRNVLLLGKYICVFNQDNEKKFLIKFKVPVIDHECINKTFTYNIFINL